MMKFHILQNSRRIIIKYSHEANEIFISYSIEN